MRSISLNATLNVLHVTLSYVRALASDIAGWKLEGWTWDRVLDIYKSIETYRVGGVNPIPPHHGTKGVGQGLLISLLND
jgi:hypothetical protein